MKRIDILGIQAFICIAESGSFNAAADFLNISQTALTRRLQKLEEGLGLQLVSRTTRSMSITRAGLDFLPRASRLVRELGIACDELKEQAGARQETIAIGCLPTLAAGPLVPVIRRFGEAWPKVRVQVIDRSASEIREAVLRGELAFAISTLDAPHRDLQAEHLFAEPMVAACPPEHALASRTSLRWKDLEGEALIGIGALSANRMLLTRVTEANKLDLPVTFEVQHLATAVGLVRGGAGIAVLPLSAVSGVHGVQLAVVPLTQPRVMRRLQLMHRRDAHPTPAATDLREVVRRHLRRSRAG